MKLLKQIWWLLNDQCYHCGSWEVHEHINGKYYCDTCGGRN